MNVLSLKISALCLLCALSIESVTAQLVLAPKPEKSVPANRMQSRQLLDGDRVFNSAKGWHFETAVGAAVWGVDSQCSCNALTADVGFHYVTLKGFLVGSNVILTNTINSSFSPTLKIGYQEVKATGEIGTWSLSLLGGPSIGNVSRNQFSSSEAYSGFVYGGEITFQPRLGSRSHLRGIMAFGWLTQREAFTTQAWQGATETKMTHSGLRIRFGITL